MNKVIIIGGGFAGISAAKVLAQERKAIEVTLVDRKPDADFLPMLPDCIGRRINPDFLSSDLKILGQKHGFEFIEEEVTLINLNKKELRTPARNLTYDWLLISSGSETNFYANKNIEENAFKIDSGNDIKNIMQALSRGNFTTFVVAGGGYTGIEVATNLRKFLRKQKRSAKIIIVERAASILGPLPQWMKDYVARNLSGLDIEVLVNDSIARVEQGVVILASGQSFKDALLIWAAGVKTPAFIQSLEVEKNTQGRIKVDKYLRLSDNCFVAGDAACFANGTTFLRMAVQFAIKEGECAAGNILRQIKGHPLKEFKPTDFGYIIPMANNRSCGNVFGVDLKGILATMLHFIMCIFRSFGLRNKLGIIRDLLTGGGE